MSTRSSDISSALGWCHEYDYKKNLTKKSEKGGWIKQFSSSRSAPMGQKISLIQEDKHVLQTYSKIFQTFRLEKKILSSTYFHFKKGNLPKLALELPAVETTERWGRTSIPFPPPPPFAPFPPPFTPPVSLDLPPSGKSSTAGVRWAKFDQILGHWGLDANRIYVGTINNLWRYILGC